MSKNKTKKLPEKAKFKKAGKRLEITRLKGPPEIKRKAAVSTLDVKKKGKEKSIKAMIRNEILRLRQQFLGSIFQFSTQDINKLSRALGVKFEKGLTDQDIKKVIKGLSMETLRQAEDVEAGTGARIFAQLITGKEKGENILKPIDFGHKFKESEKLIINFRGNMKAYWNYGMRDLFKKQPEIRKVRLTQKGGSGKSGIATRRALDGNFYFADGTYAAIFTNTEIEIMKVWSSKEKQAYLKESRKFAFGKQTRWLSSSDVRFYRKHYGFIAPKQSDTDGVIRYWDNIDRTAHKQRPSRRPRKKRYEYVPRNVLERQFIKKWEEIQTINNPDDLIRMKNDIIMRPNDPLVYVPEESRGKKLRSGAALRYALFKQHAKLKGVNVKIISGYRSARSQERIWNNGLAKRTRKLREKYPNMSEDELRRRAYGWNRRYIAPPGRSHHNTGGAVDLRFRSISSGRKIEMFKYKSNKRSYMHALRTGDLGRLSGNNRKAVETRMFLDQELKASHFLGTNYYVENWHWNIDRIGEENVYKNV